MERPPVHAARDAYVAERQYFGVDPRHPYLLESVLPEPVPDLHTRAPSQLLTARNRVVPFSGRETELAGLTAWREADDRHSIRLLHGVGGLHVLRAVHQDPGQGPDMVGGRSDDVSPFGRVIGADQPVGPARAAGP